MDPSTEIPSGYVSTPIGWTHPSCIHAVPNGAFVDGNDNVYDKGQLVAHYDKCQYKPVLAGDSSGRPAADGGGNGNPGPGSGDTGWIEKAFQNVAVSSPYNLIQGRIQVMTNPSNDKNDAGVDTLLYFFQGLESDESDPPTDGCGILQPVLQWGSGGAAGGGEYWAYTSWWWSETWYAEDGYPSGYYAPLITTGVVTNDYVVGQMELSYTESEGRWIWTITDEDVTNGRGLQSSLQVLDECSYDNYAVAFESYGGITNCGQLPHQAHFTDIYLYQALESLGSQAPVVPSMSFWFQSGLIPCGWGVSAGLIGAYEGSVTLTMK